MRIGKVPPRGRAICSGVIDAITIEPASTSPTYSAILIDEDAHVSPGAAAPGRLRLLWLGRRRVPGIDVGTRVRVEGMVSLREGLPTMFNPRYEIIRLQER